MKLYERQWIKSEYDLKTSKKLAQEMGLFLPVAQHLVSKGIVTLKDAQSYLHPDFDFLNGINSIKNTFEASQILIDANNHKEKILIYGDYDVDGITSTYILYDYLKSLGADVSYFIPDRHIDGYGLSIDALQKRIGDFDLIITVDCGITSMDVVEYLNHNGKKVIITDHHQPKDVLPQATIVNPKCDSVAYQGYAGVGVVFQLLLEMQKLTGQRINEDSIAFVAIGTVADLMPLSGINRVLVKLGINRMPDLRNKGLRKLIELSKVDLSKLSASDIGFKIAPKINATGRLMTADLALELFMESDDEIVFQQANQLVEYNNQRRQIEKDIVEEAKLKVNRDASFILIQGDDWNEGVIGIVSSRLVEEFRRPCIVLTKKDDMLKGSGRSIGEFNLLGALNASSDLIEKYGGHQYAAGLTIDPLNFERLEASLNDFADNNLTDSDTIRKSYYLDEIESNFITSEFIHAIDELRPFGLANPKPLFLLKNVTVAQYRKIGKNGEHLKLNLQIDNRIVDGLAFNQSANGDLLKRHKKIDIVGSVEKNIYLGVEYVNIFIKDFRLADDIELTDQVESKLYNHSLYKMILNYHLPVVDRDYITLEAIIENALTKDYYEIALPDPVDGKIVFNNIIDLKEKRYSQIFEKRLIDQLPQRSDLIAFYKRLERNKKLMFNKFEEKRNDYRELISSVILSEIGLCEIENSNETVQVLMKKHDKGQKMNLMDSQTYQNTFKFKEDWDEFKR